MFIVMIIVPLMLMLICASVMCACIPQCRNNKKVFELTDIYNSS